MSEHPLQHAPVADLRHHRVMLRQLVPVVLLPGAIYFIAMQWVPVLVALAIASSVPFLDMIVRVIRRQRLRPLSVGVVALAGLSIGLALGLRSPMFILARGAIVSGLQGDRNLQVALPTEDDARASVKHGRTSVAAIIPSGFGDAAGQAFFGSAPKPALDRLYDPSRSAEVAMVRGMLTEHVMQAVSREIFGGAQGRQYVERMLPQIEASQSLPPDQKRLLTEMLRWCRSSTTARIRPRRPPDPGCRCRTRSASRR